MQINGRGNELPPKNKSVWLHAGSPLKKYGVRKTGLVRGNAVLQSVYAPVASQEEAAFLVRLDARHQEAEDIVRLEFVRPNGEALPPFGAGDHILFELRGGLQRAYSLCNAPSETDRYVIAVLNEPNGRGGSRAMHALEVGDEVLIRGPRNNFALHGTARRHILLAGGIGVTPLLSMAHRLQSEGGDFELHYGVRSARRLAFRELMTSGPFASHVQLYMQDDAASAAFDIAAILGEPKPDTHAYVCGPSGFIDHVVAKARDNGWSEGHVHWEYFAAPDDDAPREDVPFEIEMALSGKVISVGAGETAADALIREGGMVVTSCAEGICGTCILELLDGTPDHRDHYLRDEDKARGDCFMPCVSRARGGRLKLNV